MTRGVSGRTMAVAAIVVLIVSVVLSTTGVASAVKARVVNVVSKPKAGAVLRLGPNKKFPASAIPKVAAARNADTVGGRSADSLTTSCNPESADLGTWCLMGVPFAVPNTDVGKNDYFYATRTCVEAGGWLPTAAQLIGAAGEVSSASTIGDKERPRPSTPMRPTARRTAANERDADYDTGGLERRRSARLKRRRAREPEDR